MHKKNVIKWFLLGMVLAIGPGLLFLPVPTNATLTWDYGAVFGIIPSGEGPFFEAKFEEIYDDINNNSDVKLTFTFKSWVGEEPGEGDEFEYVPELFFNFNPDLNIDLLDVFVVDAESDVASGAVSFNLDEDGKKNKADGLGYFDIGIFIDKKEDKLEVGEKLVLSFSYGDVDLFEDDFNFESTPVAEGEPTAKSVVKVQGIAPEGESAYVAVPEPTVLMLLGLCLIGLPVLKKRYGVKKSI